MDIPQKEKKKIAECLRTFDAVCKGESWIAVAQGDEHSGGMGARPRILTPYRTMETIDGNKHLQRRLSVDLRL